VYRISLHLLLSATLLIGCASETGDVSSSEAAVAGGRPATAAYPVVLNGHLTDAPYPHNNFPGEWTSPLSTKKYWLNGVRPGVLIAKDVVYRLDMDMPFVRKTVPTPITDQETLEFIQQERLDPTEGTHRLTRLSFTSGAEDQRCFDFLGNTDSCWPSASKKVYFETQSRQNVMQFEGGPIPGVRPAVVGDAPPVAGERCKVAGYNSQRFPLSMVEVDLVIGTAPDASGVGALAPMDVMEGGLGTGDPIFCNGQLKGFVHDYYTYSGIDKAGINRKLADMGHAPLP